MQTNVLNPQLTKRQKKVFTSILEDVFYLENILKTVEHKNLIPLSRISIIFNYISLETLRDFYCEKLSIRKDRKTGNYNWKSFFKYKNHKIKIDLILKSKRYIDLKKTEDMENFIDQLRKQRNLILHRSFSSSGKLNQGLQNYLKNIKHKNIEKIFTNSKNCIEIMSYTMELNKNIQ